MKKAIINIWDGLFYIWGNLRGEWGDNIFYYDKDRKEWQIAI